MTDEEEDEYAERIAELQNTLSKRINADPSLGHAWPNEIENDILYEGPLSPLLQFCQDNRSEIEELGN